MKVVEERDLLPLALTPEENSHSKLEIMSSLPLRS